MPEIENIPIFLTLDMLRHSRKHSDCRLFSREYKHFFFGDENLINCVCELFSKLKNLFSFNRLFLRLSLNYCAHKRRKATTKKKQEQNVNSDLYSIKIYEHIQTEVQSALAAAVLWPISYLAPLFRPFFFFFWLSHICTRTHILFCFVLYFFFSNFSSSLLYFYFSSTCHLNIQTIPFCLILYALACGCGHWSTIVFPINTRLLE